MKTTIISKRKILVLAANPIGTDRLRLDEEVREIQEGLKRSKYRGQFEIHSQWAVRLRDMRRALLDHEPQIVHFTGHGDVDGLMVEGDDGFGVKMSPKALTDLFKLCSKKIDCVILSACHSGKQAEVIGKHIRYVIGMKKGIKDKAAIEFAVGFYDALGAGQSVEKAFEFGRNAILANYPYLPEHVIPTLKINQKVKKRMRRVLVPFLFAVIFLVASFSGLDFDWPDFGIFSGKGGKTSYHKTLPRSDPDRQTTDGETIPPETGLDDDSVVDHTIVYKTRTGKKYHRDKCRYLKSSKYEIKLSEAIKQGLEPCLVCRPKKE